MAPSPARTPEPWQLVLARIEGALPFLSDSLAQVLSQRSLRRLWTVYIRDYPFDSIGLEHNPGLEAGELMRSWYASERRDFLSWISRRGPPPLARAAATALMAKGLTESFASAYDDADLALARLDGLLPSSDPVATLTAYIDQLRTEEVPFLEGGTENVVILGGFAGSGHAPAAVRSRRCSAGTRRARAACAVPPRARGSGPGNPARGAGRIGRGTARRSRSGTAWSYHR
jgi:hypothetical protein